MQRCLVDWLTFSKTDSCFITKPNWLYDKSYLIPHIHCNNCTVIVIDTIVHKSTATCRVLKVTYFFSVPFSLLHRGCCLGDMPAANECRLISRAAGWQLIVESFEMMIIILGIFHMVWYVKPSVSGKTLVPQLILDLISFSPSSWDPKKYQHSEESNKPNMLFAKWIWVKRGLFHFQGKTLQDSCKFN